METKYYTPTIDEFYPGFEFEHYEVLDLYSGDDEPKGWVKHRIQLGSRMSAGRMTTYEESIEEMVFDYDYFFKYLNWTEFRVKYLDREDIESLGFRLEQDLQDDYEFEWKIIDDNGNFVGTFFEDTEPNIEFFSINFTIKNKSELKKLLKQLGIDGKLT